MRLHVVTSGDEPLFPATLATVNSVLQFHSDAHIRVIGATTTPPTPAQRAILTASRQVHVYENRDTPWPPAATARDKARACRDFAAGSDAVAWIDPGCVLGSPIDDVAGRCRDTGRLAADSFEAPSILIAATDVPGAATLTEWTTRGIPPEARERLDPQGWCPGKDQWRSIVDFRDGQFVNLSAGQRQRMFSSADPTFWAPTHRDRLLEGHALQTYPYLWFLAMVWFGRCANWSADPHEYLTPATSHLFDDLVYFLPQIVQILPRARHAWSALTPAMITRALDGIPRMMPLEGSMLDVIGLVALHPWIRRYVEVGGYEGGSILTLALRFMVRDIDFYAVESFSGNLDGTTDGGPLPSRKRFLEHLSRFPGLRVHLVPGDSARAAMLFDDDSLDCVFIDGCHETAAVLRDIDAWIPKLRRPGIVAGDDYAWNSVFDAVNRRFADVNITPGGTIWWTLLT